VGLIAESGSCRNLRQRLPRIGEFPAGQVDMQLSHGFSHGTTAHDEERLIPLVLD